MSHVITTQAPNGTHGTHGTQDTGRDDRDPPGGPGAEEGRGRDRPDEPEAAALLERVKTVVEPALFRALDRLPGQIRRIARYHFGREDAHGAPAEAPTGKAIRPALVLTAAAALGGAGPAGEEAARAAVTAAAAVELTHNFTLLHDDVMDRDTTRRHRATAWTVFGESAAVLTGDALQALAFRLMTEDPHPAAPRAAARLADCVIELCAGQQADTALERRRPGEVTVEEVLAMAEGKTGALLGASCAIGGLYAGADEERVEALDAFGRQAGLAFQLIDDLIGLWGDPQRTGKPAGADLAVRKKSLPVVAALSSGTPAGTRLAELYAAEPRPGEDLEAMLLAVEQAGGRDWAHAQAADRMARAMHELSRAVPDPENADGLLALAEFVTRRTN
jgi:geranylgeranyl diphosphate synthase type I